MKSSADPDSNRKSAKSVSVLVFIFMCVVSAVILFTEQHLDVLDFVLIFGAPFVLSAIVYFVVLYHDPNASD